MKISVVCFVAILVFANWKTDSQEISAEQRCLNAQGSCKACLQAHPLCAWCSNITADFSRCNVASYIETRCSPSSIDNPQGSITTTADENFTVIPPGDQAVGENNDVIQLKPQAVSVKLRQGKSEKVNITFRRVLDYPLDLYYVMDLSFSMRDDLETLQRLAENLANNLQSITDNVRFGFGTFVDKVMMPYASTVPELLQNPCLRSQNVSCAPVFGFRHQLPLTENSASFRQVVNATRISGNIDSPEGGFDALMQIAVCQEQIKWRDGALRVIVFTTDASSHIAMDGKLAAILDINDMQCHLDRTRDTSETYIYSESTLQDYPSIGQLKKVFRENKIHSIFAVTEDVFPLYAELKTLLENTFVEALESDSSNVVEIIETAYRSLRDQVQLNVPTVPGNVDLQYRVLCPNSSTWTENKLECNTVRLNEEVVFQFEFNAKSCPLTANQVDVINITSSSILDRAAIQLEYVSCECSCSSRPEPNSPSCSGNGTLECGLCKCNPGNSGQKCQCTALTSGQSLDSFCSKDPSSYRPGDELCSSVGTCECGVCQCDGTSTFGKLCQCKRSGCPNDCGGEEQGTCENCDNNPICTCHNGYTLNPSRGDCSCSPSLCKAPNATEVCNGRGTCDCDKCVCESFLSGKYCTVCQHPQCTGITDGCAGPDLRECAECVYDNERQDKVVATECAEVCTERKIAYRSVNSFLTCDPCTSTPDECQFCDVLSPDSDVHQPQECLLTHDPTGCNLNYKIFWNTVTNQFQVDVLRFNRDRDCPGPVNALLIVLPVIGGIVLIGLIALILWKILQTLRDKHEYQQFLEHTNNKNWSAQENPIFANPTNRIENPAFIGN